jgi:hypothetical protein
MPGLVPGIHVFERKKEDVDGRVKHGHDDVRGLSSSLAAKSPHTNWLRIAKSFFPRSSRRSSIMSARSNVRCAVAS